MVNKSVDEDIIDVVRSIFSDSGFVVETVNESVLIELMRARGTPITNYKSSRKTYMDFVEWNNNKNGIDDSVMFYDAPVAISDDYGTSFVMSIWGDYSTISNVVRLPTVEEAPINTWLAPWKSYQKELNDLDILLYNRSDGSIRRYKRNLSDYDVNWCDIKKIMILGE